MVRSLFIVQVLQRFLILSGVERIIGLLLFVRLSDGFVGDLRCLEFLVFMV